MIWKMGKRYKQEVEVKMDNDYIATCWILLNMYKAKFKKNFVKFREYMKK